MKQPRVTRQGCGIAAHADHPRYACRRDLCDLGGGAGEWRIQDHSGETLQLFGLQWLTCQVALLYLNATREVGLVGSGAQGGCRSRIAFPGCDTCVLRQREGDGATAGEQLPDTPRWEAPRGRPLRWPPRPMTKPEGRRRVAE